jgi:hypothetical protein
MSSNEPPKAPNGQPEGRAILYPAHVNDRSVLATIGSLLEERAKGARVEFAVWVNEAKSEYVPLGLPRSGMVWWGSKMRKVAGWISTLLGGYVAFQEFVYYLEHMRRPGPSLAIALLAVAVSGIGLTVVLDRRAGE